MTLNMILHIIRMEVVIVLTLNNLKGITREGSFALIFELVPKSTFFQHVAIMWTTTVIGVDVEKLKLGTGNT